MAEDRAGAEAEGCGREQHAGEPRVPGRRGCTGRGGRGAGPEEAAGAESVAGAR